MALVSSISPGLRCGISSSVVTTGQSSVPNIGPAAAVDACAAAMRTQPSATVLSSTA
mgnify:CR=1 FL=1